MKKIALVIALAIASLGAAQAQNAQTQKQMRGVFGAGLTFGGDKLITVEYEDGTEMAVRAGGLVAMNAGIDYRVTDAFSFQATVGYHVDNSSARNGDARFERIPLEVLAYFHVSPNWRIGGGARYVSNTKFKTSGVLEIDDVAFDNTISGVLEAEYLVSSHVGFKLRYARETYEPKQFPGKVDGSHVGILANLYF